jgi:hypothetical protein
MRFSARTNANFNSGAQPLLKLQQWIALHFARTMRSNSAENQAASPPPDLDSLLAQYLLYKF